MNKTFFQFIFFTFYITKLLGQAQPLPLHLDADATTYDGKKICLQGNVTIENNLGKISSNYTELLPSQNNKKITFEKMMMKGEVSVTFLDNAQLNCHQADIYYDTLKGFFYGQDVSHPTIYTHPSLLEKTAVEIRAAQMAIQLVPLEENSSDIKSQIQSIQAHNDVSIHLQLGTITAKEAIRIYQNTATKPTQLKAIESDGYTTFTYQDKTGKSHHIDCYGGMMLDHQLLKVTLSSLEEIDHQIFEKNQVHLIDHLGEVFADNIEVIYGLKNHTLFLDKIFLLGHVRIFNNSEKDPQNSEKTYSQFALADYVEYNPATEELLLKATTRERVLFFDQKHHLQVSAPALTCKRDDIHAEPSVHGLGDVRFSFQKQELEMLDNLIKKKSD